MADKHFVVKGAICMCNFAPAPDILEVLTNQTEYANDIDGAQKSIASTMDIGATFKAGTFGPCAKMNGNPCKSVVTEWKGFYEDIVLRNGGKILLEDSKATCPIGGADCIKVIFHGQQAGVSKLNFKQASPDVCSALNPAIDIDTVLNENMPSVI